MADLTDCTICDGTGTTAGQPCNGCTAGVVTRSG